MNDQGHCMSIQTTIPDELIDRISDRLIERLRPLLTTTRKTEDDTIFDVRGLADYLKTTDAWIRDQARSGKLPCFKSGKYWKFHKRQIDKVFQSRSLIPASVIPFKT
jgi:hypothetical protein